MPSRALCGALVTAALLALPASGARADVALRCGRRSVCDRRNPVDPRRKRRTLASSWRRRSQPMLPSTQSRPARAPQALRQIVLTDGQW